MSDRNNNDFDLSGFENFEDDPGFSLDSESIEMAPVAGATGRRNTRFIVLASLLVLLILLGALAIVLLAISEGERQTAFRQTSEAVFLTNTAVAVALLETGTANAVSAAETANAISINQTQTAIVEAYTDTPTPTLTPTDTPSATPTATLNIAATETADYLLRLTLIPIEQTGTANALALTAVSANQTGTADALNAGNLTATANALNNNATGTAFALTAQAGDLSAANQTGTASALNATGTAGAAGPGFIFPGNGTAIPVIIEGPIIVINVTNTRVPPTQRGTPGTPDLTLAAGGAGGNGSLPNTGFLDELSGGTSNPGQLLLLGGMALGLVSVIAFARRMRRV